MLCWKFFPTFAGNLLLKIDHETVEHRRVADEIMYTNSTQPQVQPALVWSLAVTENKSYKGPNSKCSEIPPVRKCPQLPQMLQARQVGYSIDAHTQEMCASPEEYVECWWTALECKSCVSVQAEINSTLIVLFPNRP